MHPTSITRQILLVGSPPKPLPPEPLAWPEPIPEPSNGQQHGRNTMAYTATQSAPADTGSGLKTARELMTPNPVSIREDATFAEAVAFLTDTGFSAAPVIDESGRPVGVISRTDIVVHERERLAIPPHVPEFYGKGSLTERGTGQEWTSRELEDPARVRELMTPAVFAVAPDVPADKVARQMVQLNVHRLFVVDRDGVLVGVVSALDLLAHLCP
jgi:CBS domain-containing protein